MNDEVNDMIGSAAEGAAKGAVEGLAKKIPPLYTDFVQPGAQEIGKGVANVVKILMSPFAATVWGFDRIADFLDDAIPKRLLDIPYEELKEPPINIIGPALEGLKYMDGQPELREMFANLIAKGFRKDMVTKVHPGFVQIVKELTGGEARVLEYIFQNNAIPGIDLFTNNDETMETRLLETFVTNVDFEIRDIITDLDSTVIDNLLRLRLIKLVESTAEQAHKFDEIRATSYYKHLIGIDRGNLTVGERIFYYSLTTFGYSFCECCLE